MSKPTRDTTILTTSMYYEFNIYGLAYSCPAGKRKKDCPFYEMEHLSFKEKVIWINKLGSEKLNLIIKHHIECSMN